MLHLVTATPKTLGAPLFHLLPHKTVWGRWNNILLGTKSLKVLNLILFLWTVWDLEHSWLFCTLLLLIYSMGTVINDYFTGWLWSWTNKNVKVLHEPKLLLLFLEAALPPTIFICPFSDHSPDGKSEEQSWSSWEKA